MITIHLRFTDAFGYKIWYWERLILFQKNSVEWYCRTSPYGYLHKTDISLLRSFFLVLKIQVIQFLPLYYGQFYNTDSCLGPKATKSHTILTSIM